MKARGIALVTGLMVLAAISLLALTAAGGMTLQQRQAANFQDRFEAESGADRALAAAVAWLYSRPDSDRQQDCVTGCFLPAAIEAPGALPAQPEFLPPTWWTEHGTGTGRHPVSGAVLEPAEVPLAGGHWIAQEIRFERVANGPVTGIGYYRILGRGVGRQVRSVAVTASIVARPWGGATVPAAYPPVGPLRGFCTQFEASTPCGVLAWRSLR